MTKQYLEEIRARCEAATSGPWQVDSYASETDHRVKIYTTESGHRHIAKWVYDDDAQFVARARQDIPALLDALEAALARAEALERALVGNCKVCVHFSKLITSSLNNPCYICIQSHSYGKSFELDIDRFAGKESQ